MTAGRVVIGVRSQRRNPAAEAIVLIGGLIFSSPIVLVILPVMYGWFELNSKWLKKINVK